MVLRSRSFRWAATPEARSGRCWRRSSCCRKVSVESHGSPSRPSQESSFSIASASGGRTIFRSPLRRICRSNPVIICRTVIAALFILAALIFSKYFYLASLTSYYTFYLISRFGVSVRSAQLHLFVFLGSAAAGTFFGGPIGDRIGPKYVIWGSILGVLPFTLLLPHANLFWTGILSAIIGFVIASAFSAILVYAQELMPGRVGLVSGIFFGLAFGVAGIGAAALGRIADMTSIVFVYRVCAWLPAIGLLTGLLPDLDRQRP